MHFPENAHAHCREKIIEVIVAELFPSFIPEQTMHKEIVLIPFNLQRGTNGTGVEI